MLQATIEENSLNITPRRVQELLDATFVEAECAEAGTMTFDEYQALVTKKPQLLEFMTITSLNQVIAKLMASRLCCARSARADGGPGLSPDVARLPLIFRVASGCEHKF